MLVLGALYLAERGDPAWAGYLGVLGGYAAGLLAARYDVGIERTGGRGGESLRERGGDSKGAAFRACCQNDSMSPAIWNHPGKSCITLYIISCTNDT